MLQEDQISVAVDVNWSELKIPARRLFVLGWIVLFGCSLPAWGAQDGPLFVCGTGLAEAGPRKLLAVSPDPEFLSRVAQTLTYDASVWNVSWVGTPDDIISSSATGTWDAIVVDWDRDVNLGATAVTTLVSPNLHLSMVLVSNTPATLGLASLIKSDKLAALAPEQLNTLPTVLRNIVPLLRPTSPSMERGRRFRKYLKAFGGLSNNSNVHFFVKDGTGKFLEFNNTFASAFGVNGNETFSDERLIPAGLGYRLRGEILTSLRASDLEVITQFKMGMSVERFQVANGSVYPFFVFRFPISVSKDETVVGVIAIDVSTMNEPLLPFVPHLSIQLTGDGTIRDWNRTAEKLFGFLAGEALGANLEILLQAKRNPRTRLDGILKECLASGRWQGRLQMTTKDGEIRIIETSWTLVSVPNTKSPTFHIVGHDVTDRERYENELQRLGHLELATRIFDGIAHDFANVLIPIMGNIELLLTMRPKDWSQIESMLTSMRSGGERAGKLVESMRRASKGKVADFHPIDMNQWLTQAAEAIAQTVHPERRGVVLDIQPPDEPLWAISGDPDALITQVLTNLAINSVHAMPSGGRLIVSGRNIHVDDLYAQRHVEALPGPYVVISVTDTGGGMSEEVQSRIFVPYFTTKGEGGSGMGLFNVNRIVNLHGGFIIVYSQEGKGTHFAIHLPAIPTSGTEQDDSGLPRGHNELVLVVEDDLSLANFAQLILERAGYRVATVPNGLEALLFLDKHAAQVRAILLDMLMPGMGGQEVIRRIKSVHPSLSPHVIAASGLTQSMMLTKDEQPYAFLHKPIQKVDLLMTVHGAIHHNQE